MSRGNTTKLNASLLAGTLSLLGLIIPVTEQSQYCGTYQFNHGAAYAQSDPEVVAPELWIFGIQGLPARSVALGGRGIRGILDLRTMSAAAAIEVLERYVELDQGIIVTLRWKLPHEEGERLKGIDNRDVPPTPSEEARALWTLEQVITSEAAQRLSDHFIIQFYNEIGGGPGKFAREDLPAMLAFATKATQLIRDKAPFIKICGPAITMGQIQNRHLADDPKFRNRAEIIEAFLEWTASHADYQDVHLLGTDGTGARQVMSDIREMLSVYPGGRDLEFVSWEWSPVHLAEQYHDDDVIVRESILGIWQAMAEGGVKLAAYGNYWPAPDLTKFGDSPMPLWVSLVDEAGIPREPIYSTVRDIGMGRIAIRQPEPDPDPRRDPGDNTNNTDDPDLSTPIATDTTRLWVDGFPDDLEVVEYLGAAGIRDSVDLRVVATKDLKAAVRACADTNLGVVLATRWSDPNDPEHYDAMPDVRRANQMVSRLRSVLKSKDARAVAEHGLWVQFFAEVAGNRGRIRDDDADGLFGYAADLAGIIRATAPHAKISGPTLTNLDLLNKTDRTTEEQAQFEMLERAIDWSIKHADAVDFRLDPTSSQSLTATLRQLRAFIDAKPGGTELALVCWDWNAGLITGTVQDITAGMNAVYGALSEAGIRHAAYGPLRPDDDSDPTNDAWSLLDGADQERPLYAEAFVEIARSAGQFNSLPSETEAQRKKRLNTFKKEYRLELRVEYRARGSHNWKKESSQAYKDTWEAAWDAHELERLARYQ